MIYLSLVTIFQNIFQNIFRPENTFKKYIYKKLQINWQIKRVT